MSTVMIERHGRAYYGRIGTIKKTKLGFHEHRGFATAELGVQLDSDRWVSAGGYTLDGKALGLRNRPGTAFGMDHVLAILRVVGVNDWEELIGSRVVVLFDNPVLNGQPDGLAHQFDDTRFVIFEEHARLWNVMERA